MSHAPTRSGIALVVDPDAQQARRVAQVLEPLRVIDAISLLEAFSMVEEIRPAYLAISDRAAAESGFAMFMRMAGLVGSQSVVYGRQLPAGLPTNIPWVDLATGNLGQIGDVLFGRAKVATPKTTSERGPDLIVIGASTGGVGAIETVLSQFTEECPPTLIVQHIRPSFVESMLTRLNRCCRPHVIAARDGATVPRGTVCIAATPDHDLLVAPGARPRLSIVPAPPEAPHRPSVDALFHAAAAFGPRVVGALLTGMGADGAQGLAAIRSAGGFTIAQDRETSTVYGMPRIAAEIGAASVILPLEKIAAALLSGGSDQTARAAMPRRIG